LSGRGLCDELITRPEESSQLCCVVVCDLETSRMGAPYIYDINHLRVNNCLTCIKCAEASYSGSCECVFYHYYYQEGTLLFRDIKKMKGS